MEKLQEEFISTISHELRTPLTSIRGFSQTLLNSWDKIKDDDKKKFIGIIEEQSNRLINLVENILSVSKISSEKQVLKQVCINRTIEKVITIISHQYIDFKFIKNFDKNNPTARLDEDKFIQVIMNLLDNAAKYSDKKKEVLISTSIKMNNIVIQIKDYGIGIKEADYSKIFKKFSRLENHLTSKTQGNGLGLYITYELVSKMGGKISFSSIENEGTVFEITFPIYNPEEALKCSQQS